jgi:DNA-binding CsgD family transcriptional regulator
MDRKLADDDAALFAAARVARDFAQLPGAPSPDWCQRAAAALAHAGPRTRAWIAVVRAGGDRAPTVERAGYADEQGRTLAHAESARTLRLLTKHLAWALQPPARLGVHAMAELAARAPDTALALRLAQQGELVVGLSPLARAARDEPVMVLLALWGPEPAEPAGPLSVQDLRRVLRSAMPVLSDRLRLALGGGDERAPWLSGREHRVLDLLIRGLTVPEIADLLDRSQHTVHDYVKTLHRKLGTSSRGGLVARALGFAGERTALPAPGSMTPLRGPMLAFRTDGRTAFVDHGVF